MTRRRMLWHLYPSYLLMALIPMALGALYASVEFRDFYHRNEGKDLLVRAQLVERQLSGKIDREHAAELQAMTRTLGAKTHTRITIVLPKGEVIADSEEDPARMDNHADRPEVVDAMAGQPKAHIRYSKTLRLNMMYLAFPIQREGAMVGLVRVSLPLTAADQALNAALQKLSLFLAFILVAAALVSLIVARRISRPLEDLKRGAERFARGDLEFRLQTPESAEIGGVAESMNRMAVQLQERLQTNLEQRNEQDAVLSSMIEGVIAIDKDERILNLNQAAARLFGIDAAHALGHDVHEIIRNADLHEFLAKVLTTQKHEEGDLALYDGQDTRHLQVQGTVLRDADGIGIGALVALHDVTRLKRLEKVRSDFVANVSHELRTPITSIKGFVETLLEGAMNNPEEARRFLEIVARHADRLNAIIEDLLSLSRIEQEAEKESIVLEPHTVRPALAAACQLCETKANEKGIRVAITCDEHLTAPINPTLLEQALVNLIDNAVKYSKPGGAVSIEAGAAGSEIVLRVRDQGPGIPREHIPRLFERFYRVDKARSRTMGGTGLGLAIVKHIVLAHHGRITVDSKVGEGSVFTIYLPQASS